VSLPPFLLLLPQAATSAAPIDWLIHAINAVTIFFSAGIFIAIIILAWKYRRGNKVDRSNAPMHNDQIEVIWTVIPLIISMGIFVWGTTIFMVQRRMPKGAMEIYVTGKQWMWKVQHPTGRWENDELHVPTGRSIKLTLTSTDVIHAFYVPAFRIKTDVIPGQYTYLWFKPTRVGTYHLFCAEFCGTDHSGMVGTVTVMEPADYERWLASGSYSQTVAAEGQRLFMQHGCSGCHSGSGSVRAPVLEGIYGRPIPVQIPPAGLSQKQLEAALPKIPARTLLADDRYIHDSIVLPNQEIAAGFSPIMPQFKNRLTEEEIFQLTAYIRSLGGSQGTSYRTTGAGRNQALSAEEYRARVGFVPTNVPGGGGGTAGQPGSGASGGQRAPSPRGRMEGGSVGGQGTTEVKPASPGRPIPGGTDGSTQGTGSAGAEGSR
jgi:cytochrome c oxidase subunit 2